LFAFDAEQLAEELSKLNVPLERLELPYKSDYPILANDLLENRAGSSWSGPASV
jgi:hypothetical protein